MMLRFLLPVLAGLAAAPAAAAPPDRLSVLIGSYHASPGQDFEEFNPGLFLTWEGPVLDSSIGAYRNSYGKGAVAVAAAWPFLEGEHYALSLFLGAAYYPEDGRRFRYHLGDIVPLGGLQARAGPLFFQAIPGDGDEADAVFSFGVTMPLGRR